MQQSEKQQIIEISNFIRNWLINENLNMVDFSKIARVHPMTIFNFLHQKDVLLSSFVKIVSATGLSFSQILEDK